MPKRARIVSIPMPTLGVDAGMPSTFINARSAVSGTSNVRFDHGYAGPRPGSAKLGSASLPFTDEVILGLAAFYEIDGDQILLAITNADVKRYIDASDMWTALDISGLTNDPLQGSVNSPISFAHLAHDGSGGNAGTWYFAVCNEKNPVFLWDGTNNPENLLGADGYNASITTHIAKQIFSYKNSLCLLAPQIDGIEQPQRIQWSATGDITEWDFTTTNAGFLDDPPGYFQWAAPLSNYYVLYKKDAIAILSYTGGVDLFRIDTVVQGGGLLSPGMLAVLEGEHIYISKDNVFRWGGGPTPTPIGDRIFQDLADNLNWDAIDASRTLIDKENNHIIFYIPSGSSSFANRAYVYDYRENWWSIDDYPTNNVTAVGMWGSYSALYWSDIADDFTWSDWTTETWADLAPTEGQNIPIIGDDTGYIFSLSLSSKNDNISAIDQIYMTPYIVPDKNEYQSRRTRYLSIEFEAKGDSVTVSRTPDDGDATWTSIGTQALTSSWTRYKLNYSTTERRLRFKFQNNSAASNFQIRWVGVKVIPRGGGT